MHLLLRRSQRDDGWFSSSMVFILDARLDLTEEEQHLFEKYGLGELVIYSSDDRIQNLHSAYEHYDRGAQPLTPIPLLEPSVAQLANQFAELGKMVWHGVVGAGYDVAAWLSLQLTLQSLVDGQHLETQSLEEVVALSDVIEGAVEYLSNYLELAVTYDGREELNEY